MEKSPAMVCRIYRYTSGQLSSDVRFSFGELHLSTAGRSQGLRCKVADGSRGLPAVAVPYLSAHRLVLVEWLRCWIGFASNTLGKRGIISIPLWLSLYSSIRLSLKSLHVPVSSAGGL